MDKVAMIKTITAIGRSTAVFGAVTGLVIGVGIAPASAVGRPTYDPALVPPNGPPESPEPMRQTNPCIDLIALPEPDVARRAPGFDLLNIEKAWEYSTGNGVPVAVIDTGVTPSPRLNAVPGGDYVMGGDGLSDCDSHGTVVASIIAARPQGTAAPRPMPALPAFVTPGHPPVAAASPPGLGAPPELAPPPPPPAATVTITAPPPAPAPPAPPPEGGDEVAPAWGNEPLEGPQFPLEPAPAPPNPPAPPPPDAPDGVVGVAPDATIIAIRQSSLAFGPVHPRLNAGEPTKAGNIETLAASIVHAAELGAKVINISVTACVAPDGADRQGVLGAAVWWAATVKDAVIVAASGNVQEANCDQNPMMDPLDPGDPRDWHQVKSVSLPSYFSDYVLSVAAVTSTGDVSTIDKSMKGPWIGVAGPGTDVMGLSPQTGRAVNAIPQINNNPPSALWGTSFSAAYVSGVAALVRAKYPQLTAHQVINRILRTAHNPAAGVDNAVGYGLIDPVAALTFDVPLAERVPAGAQSRIVTPPAPPAPPDNRARNIAVGAVALVCAVALAGSGVSAAYRRRSRG